MTAQSQGPSQKPWWKFWMSQNQHDAPRRFQKLIGQKLDTNEIIEVLRRNVDPAVSKLIRKSPLEPFASAAAVWHEAQSADISQLADELLTIARKDGFIYSKPDVSGGSRIFSLVVDEQQFDANGLHRRARKIGEILNARGGVDLMNQIADAIAPNLDQLPSEYSARPRCLQFCWDQVGAWRK